MHFLCQQLDEALYERQQQAYKIEGVDENANTAAENIKKRKAEMKVLVLVSCFT